MGAELLLTSLQARGAVVSLTPEGKIRVEAPEALIDDALRTRIRLERDGLIALLQLIAQHEEQVCQAVSFASAASAQSLEETTLRTMRTQRPQVCTPDLVRRAEVRSSALAPVPSSLPDAWRAGLGQLRFMPLPTGFDTNRWNVGVRWARRIAVEHGPAALVMGWGAEDLFGLHPVAPAARYDSIGLAFVMKGTDCIVSLNDERAVLRSARGSTTTFPLGRRSSESRPAWELLGRVANRS
jgi:hypothetical protein